MSAVGTGTVLDIDELLGKGADGLAFSISNQYQEWQTLRQRWIDEKRELRNYLFATDTKTTTNKTLPWKNSTTVPKLTQIRDNLHANYMAALFPHRDWLTWEGDDEKDEQKEKREAIEGYMRTKFRQDKAEIVISQLILDWIDYGNCFATVEWVDESREDEEGEIIRGYVGPRIVRISPLDIVFNPLATSFDKSPKIFRTVKSFGELKKRIEALPPGEERSGLMSVIAKSAGIRTEVQNATDRSDTIKSDGFQMDGFSSVQNYFSSDQVEILTFMGDIYDVQKDELLEDHKIVIIDRSFVLVQQRNPSWVANAGIFHAGWRQRPDNLYAMGPLDNLVGMQYRIDHLENLKADVFDMIAHPMWVIQGFVEDFDPGPGTKIYVGDDGDVKMLSPDVTALNADLQIERLEQRMEELAGAPREAMGIRTPGEKTAFEVQRLDNASGRLFLNKIKHYEIVFFEELMNFGLEVSRRNMSAADTIRTLDSEVDAVIFSTITPDDIVAQGILRPVGASHFERKANILQNITTLLNSAVANDEAVKVHLSGKKIAKLLEEVSDLDDFKVFKDNARIMEQLETQQLAAQAQERAQATALTPPGITESDPDAPPEEAV